MERISQQSTARVMDDPEISRHAERRLKKRLGIKKRACARVAKNALLRGTKNGLEDRMDGYYEINDHAVIYMQSIFIFRENKLITVYPAPKNMRR